MEGASWLTAAWNRPQWQPGAGGMCLHTILQDPKTPGPLYVAISAVGAFRSHDDGETWKPITKGLHSKYIPNPTAEVGHCVHRIAFHDSNPDTLYMQKHWDVMRSDNAGESWEKISGDLPSDFWFPIEVHAQEPETIYVIRSVSRWTTSYGSTVVAQEAMNGNRF